MTSLEIFPKNLTASQMIFGWLNDARAGLEHMAESQDDKSYYGLSLRTAAQMSFECPEIAQHIVGLHNACEETGQLPNMPQIRSVARLIASLQPVKLTQQ